MKKILGFFALILLSAVPALAQLSASRVEVGGGYTYRSFDYPPAFNEDNSVQNFPRANMNGWDGNAVFNLNSWIGVAGDVDGTRNSAPDSIAGTDVIHVYTVMGGLRAYPLGHHRVTPFVEGLAGHGYYTVYIPAAGGGPFTFSDGSFAWAAGGGVDLTVSRHFAVRLGEFDYERTSFNSIASSGLSDANNNYKFKAGLVVRF